MIKELSPYFQGPLQEIGAFLTLQPAPADVRLADFLEGDGCQRALSLFARRFDQPHPQATASQWSKLYFSRLLPAVLIPTILGGRQLPLSPPTVHLRLDSEGSVTALVLAHAGEAMPDAGDRLSWLVEAHLALVIAALSTASGLPAKVLWNNAGNLLEGTLNKAAALLGPDHAGLGEVKHLITVRRKDDGRPNPLHEPVRYRQTDEGVRRIRKLCCLRYLTPSLGLCSSCPKPNAPDRGADTP